MFVKRMSDAPWREREGLVSRIMLEESDVSDGTLTVTWVEVAPG